MIKAVIFDIGNVLIKWPAEAVSEDIRQALHLSEAQMKTFYSEHMPELGLGHVTEERFWAGVTTKLGTRKVDSSEHLLSRVFEEQGTVYQNVLACAETLKARGLQTALLSNTIAAHEAVFTKKGITDPFDFIFLSHKMELRKPDPEIYKRALHDMHIDATEAIFVDDLAENIAAAQVLGIHAIHAIDPDDIPDQIEQVLKEAAL